MKTISRVVKIIVLLMLSTCMSAKATLIQATDANFGLNSLTIDTTTGLHWLDLTASAGLSYDQVISDMQPGGIFNGYRFATASEVVTFYNSAGIPSSGDYPAATPAILSFISLVGATSFQDGHPETFGLTGTSYPAGLQLVAGIDFFYNNGVPEYEISGVPGQSGTSFGDNYGTPTVSSWLVASVPETTDASIYVLSAAGLIGFSFLQRRQKLHDKNIFTE